MSKKDRIIHSVRNNFAVNTRTITKVEVDDGVVTCHFGKTGQQQFFFTDSEKDEMMRFYNAIYDAITEEAYEEQ